MKLIKKYEDLGNRGEHLLVLDEKYSKVLIYRKGHNPQSNEEDVECWMINEFTLRKIFGGKNRGKRRLTHSITTWLRKYGEEFINTFFSLDYEEMEAIFNPQLQTFVIEFWDDILVPLSKGELSDTEWTYELIEVTEEV